MNLFHPATTRVPQTAADYAQQHTCTACRRTGVELEMRAVTGAGPMWLCVDPTGCRHHWPAG